MSLYCLNRGQPSPPGGYPYYQGGDKPHKFATVPVLDDQARAVASYRAANGLPRSTFEEALIDVDIYTCARIGNNRRFCRPCDTADSAQSSEITPPPRAAGCKGCGASVH